MDSVITTEKDVEALEARVRKLAGEKSSLELVISLMNRMSEAPGLENTIENMLRAVGDVIGGVNLTLYYCIDGEVHFADINRSRGRLETIVDPLVRTVFETHQAVEQEHPFRDTQMTTPEFAHAYTWAVPLLVGTDLIGVFEIESLHIGMGDMSRELPTFFTYAALVLKNEILDHSQLQEAHDALAQEVTIRKRAEEELRELNRDLEERVSARTRQLHSADQKANRLAAIVQSSEDAIIGKDLNGIITSWNPGAERIYGYSESEAIGRSISILLPPGHEGEGDQIIERILAGEHIDHYEAVRCTQHGDRLLMSLTISPIRNAEGTIIAASTIARDITEKKRAEDAIRRSLREKEIMLKEIHHRVKNNLQIISSLLNLQSTRYNEPGICKAFDESQRRVRTMALVHEQLYRSENFASIDFGEHLTRIARELMSAYGRSGIELLMDVAPVSLSIDSAIPCGLIANELVSNALKHAFPAERCGVITIRLQITGADHACMVVADDGIGLPARTGISSYSTLGMSLVSSLADQIDGRLTIDASHGSTFTLDIPLTPEE
jgi:PAS domain S-box-containing protein